MERPTHVLIEVMEAGDVDDFVPKADDYMDTIEAENRRLREALAKNERTAEKGTNTGEVDKQFIYLNHIKRDSHYALMEVT